MKIDSYYKFYKEFGESLVARKYFDAGHPILDVGDMIRAMEKDMIRSESEIDRFNKFWSKHLETCSNPQGEN